jgi:general secretion pathway protein J
MKPGPHNIKASRVRVSRALGFTLVEMLLAMTLMSMLMALAYGGFRASTRATDRGQVILEESGRIRMAHQFVRKQLNQMVPLVFMESEEQEQRSIFEGSSDKIRFVAQMPGYLGFGGPQVQELTFQHGEEGLVLVISHALLQGFEEEKLYERDPIVLLDRIDQAEFQFLGLDEEGELSAWSNVWEDPEKLPLAVSLDIEFNEEVYVRWPLLTASVRVDAQALSELAGELGLGPNAGRRSSRSMQKMIQTRKQQQ